MKKALRSAALLAGIAWAAQGAGAAQLIVNGGFESGLSGWSQRNANLGQGGWYATGATTAPLSGQLTVGAASGNGYALADQDNAGVQALIQSFTVAPGIAVAVLSFDMFVNSYFGAIDGPLDVSAGPVQIGRVDLLDGAADDFDTGAGVLRSLYLGVDDTASNPNGYTRYSYDLGSLLAAGGSFKLRFATAETENYLNMGVDNVSLAVPEPGSMALMLLGLGGVAAMRRRRQG